MHFPRPHTRRGWLLSGLVLAVLGAGVGAAIWADRYYPWRHFRTVVPGGVYRAGQPTAENVATAVERYGIKTLVNLRAERGPWFEEEKQAAEKAGIAFVDVPIPEGQPPTPEQVNTLLAIYDDPARRPLLFHCQYGSIRSAGVEALYRMEVLGESNEQALDRTRTFGTDLEQKYPQIVTFIRAYVPRAKRVGVIVPGLWRPDPDRTDFSSKPGIQQWELHVYPSGDYWMRTDMGPSEESGRWVRADGTVMFTRVGGEAATLPPSGNAMTIDGDSLRIEVWRHWKLGKPIYFKRVGALVTESPTK